MSASNVALLHEFLDVVWNQGDPSDLEEYVAPSYEILHDPGDPWDGRTLSLEDFAERVRSAREMFPDLHVEVLETIAQDDRVVVTWTWQGTHQGDVPGLAATGREVRSTGVTVYQFKDGKIANHWQVADRLDAMQQLIPPKV